ncbi:MAG: hypothetical protein IT370_12055 [Deltaproteobacteria bacterium]|nr:hypothetical protein [Deltaproteobacteria bacterium]
MVDTPWRASLAVSVFSTTVNLDGRDVDLAEASVSASVGYHPGPKYGASLGLGAILGGRIDSDTRDGSRAGAGEGDIDPGFLATLSGTWLARYETERGPFVMASLSLGFSTTTADSEADGGAPHRLTSGDARVGVMVGKTYGRLTPYLVVRAFGGPVLWTLDGEAVSGGDVHHYTIGLGSSLRLPARLGRVDGFLELMPLGERSASAGLSLSF